MKILAFRLVYSEEKAFGYLTVAPHPHNPHYLVRSYQVEGMNLFNAMCREDEEERASTETREILTR